MTTQQSEYLASNTKTIMDGASNIVKVIETTKYTDQNASLKLAKLLRQITEANLEILKIASEAYQQEMVKQFGHEANEFTL